MGLSGLEPLTSRLSGVRSDLLSYKPLFFRRRPRPLFLTLGGDEENRTPDPLLARQVLSQLSYAPNLLKVEPSKLNINLSECASTCRTQHFHAACTP